MNLDLHEIAKDIYFFCAEHNILLKVIWIPRELNQDADDLSKDLDLDDWGVSTKIFNLVQNRINKTFTLDAFADSDTAKCKLFYSKYWCIGSAGVDGLEYDWEGHICWLVPPIKLISRTISHLKRCRGYGVIIVPSWRSAAFWPSIHNGGGFRYGIRVMLEFRKPSCFFISGIDANDMFTERAFCSDVLILELNFK
jgi:hypothetical protein